MWELFVILTAVLNLSISMITISTYRVTIKKYVLFLFIILPFAYMTYFISEFWSTIIVFFAIVITNYINTHKKGESFIVASLCVLNAFIADGILSNIGVGIFKLNMSTFMQKSANMCFYFLAMILLQLLICISIRKLIENRYEMFNLNLPKVQYGLIILLLVSSVGVIIYNANIGKINGLSNSALWMTNIVLLSYGVVIMVILIFLIRSGQLEQKRQLELQELEHNKLELKQLKVYTKELESMYEEIRGIKHDFSNILTGIATMIVEKRYDDLEVHYSNVLMPLIKNFKQNYYKLGNLQNMKIQELKGLLAVKVIEAYQKNIDFSIEMPITIEKAPSDILKLCRIIGILLDNAIEESECCENGYIKCSFIMQKDEIIFIIRNKSRKKDTSIQKLIEKGYSTKGENRGLGLYNLNQMISTSEDIKHFMEHKEDSFQATVTFKV